MKRSFTLLLSVMYFVFSFSQNKEEIKPKEQFVNFGVKAGFNSSMYFVEEFKIIDVTIDKVQNNYKVGYFTALFMRLNMQKHFLQPELHYTVSKSEIEFDKKGSDHPEIDPEYASIEATIHMIEFPVLYGYNFVKKNPYGMSFFVGPKIKHVWKQKSRLEFGNFDQADIEEELYPFNFSLVTGLGVMISNIFFDFTYEIGLHNISKSITYEDISPETPERKSNLIFNRRNNLLSFSLGVIF